MVMVVVVVVVAAIVVVVISGNVNRKRYIHVHSHQKETEAYSFQPLVISTCRGVHSTTVNTQPLTPLCPRHVIHRCADTRPGAGKLCVPSVYASDAVCLAGKVL